MDRWIDRCSIDPERSLLLSFFFLSLFHENLVAGFFFHQLTSPLPFDLPAGANSKCVFFSRFLFSFFYQGVTIDTLYVYTRCAKWYGMHLIDQITIVPVVRKGAIYNGTFGI